MACSCMAYVGLGVAAGAMYGLAAGACSGTLNAFKYKIPGLLKIRYIGKYTLLSTAAGGIFLGSGCLMDCGKLSRWAAEEDAARSSSNQRF